MAAWATPAAKPSKKTSKIGESVFLHMLVLLTPDNDKVHFADFGYTIPYGYPTGVACQGEDRPRLLKKDNQRATERVPGRYQTRTGHTRYGAPST